MPMRKACIGVGVPSMGRRPFENGMIAPVEQYVHTETSNTLHFHHKATYILPK